MIINFIHKYILMGVMMMLIMVMMESSTKSRISLYVNVILKLVCWMLSLLLLFCFVLCSVQFVDYNRYHIFQMNKHVIFLSWKIFSLYLFKKQNKHFISYWIVDGFFVIILNIINYSCLFIHSLYSLVKNKETIKIITIVVDRKKLYTQKNET